VTTFTDGAPPSVTPEPDDGSVPHRADAPGADQDPDTGSWLQDEIQRRIAEAAAAGGAGRHARRGEPMSSSSTYVPRHSVATPGPGAPRPGPVGGQMSQASELLRRERTEGTSARPVWSGPPTRPVETRPDAAELAAPPPTTADPTTAPPDDGAKPGVVRPGIAAAAAMRGAARGRARAAAAPPVAPAPPAPPQPGEVSRDPSATTPVEIPPVEITPVETAPVETAPPPDAGSPAPSAAAPSAAPTGPMPAPLPPAGAAPSGAVPTETVAPSAPPPATAPPQAGSPDPVAAEHTAPVPPVPPAPADEEPSSGPEQADSPSDGITVPRQRGVELRASRFVRFDDSIEPVDHTSKRVRVVLAERKGVARPVRTVITIQESSGVGELLRTNLIGSQLAIALRFAIGAGLTLGLLPLLFAVVPEIGRVEVFGLRLPWLLLGVLVYPFLFGLGLWHTRTAEHLEQNFAETVQD
jgi:hypothetical protein